MGVSCSDFTDGVLELLGELGFLRQEDVPDDDPEGQLRVATDALSRVAQVHRMGLELAKQVQSDGLASNVITKMAEDLLRASESITPKFLVCEDYGHIFDGDGETKTRWVMDLRTGDLVLAQFWDKTWKSLSPDDVRDLLESVRDANDVRANPQDFGALTADEMPAW